MIGKDCRYKNTWVRGKINGELKATDKFPDQWKVYWYGSIDGHPIYIRYEHSKWLAFIDLFRRTKPNVYGGMLNVWNNKEDITILN